MNILVRNLDESITKERLIKLFLPFGNVLSASIVTDQMTGKSRGFGFVEMPEETEAENAIKTLHHTKLEGLKIRVKAAKPEYGPEYFANEKQLPEGAAQPETALDKTTPREMSAGEGQARSRRPFKPYPSREREGSSREFKPRGGYIRQRPDGSGGRPAARYRPSEGEKREYQPRTEGYRPRSAGEEGGRPRPSYPSSEGSRREFKPRSGGYSRPGAGEHSARPFNRYKPSEGGKREYQPRTEGYRPRRPGEEGGRPRSSYPSSEGSRREFKPRSGGYSRPGAGAHGAKPRYPSKGRSGKKFTPRPR